MNAGVALLFEFECKLLDLIDFSMHEEMHGAGNGLRGTEELEQHTLIRNVLVQLIG